MRTKLVCFGVILLTLTFLTTSRAVHAQLIEHRAGTAGFLVGQAGISILFAVPFLSPDYAVVVQPTNTAGYSPVTACTYFNVLHKTSNGFEVQHKRCNNGVPVPVDVTISLDWIAVSTTEP